MSVLARQICLNHPRREAVARCVECARFFCRECIADHDGRLTCASCLQKLARAGVKAPSRWPAGMRAVAKSMAGFLLAWFCFHSLGRTLLQLPSRFHEENFWKATWGKMQDAAEDD